MEFRYPLTKYVYRRLSLPIANTIYENRAITPDMITVFATLLGFLSAYLIFLQSFIAAAFFLLLSQIFDCVDGDLARLRNELTRKGAYLDRILDRFVDGVIIIALISLNPGKYWLVGSLALFATLLVSASRILAESLGIECSIGIATRDLRTLATFVALILNQILALLYFLSFFGFITAFQRIAYSLRMLSRKEAEGEVKER